MTCLPVDRRRPGQARRPRQGPDRRTFLVSIMPANNETGSLQPIRGPGQDLTHPRESFSIPMPFRPSAKSLWMWKRWELISYRCRDTSFMGPRVWAPCISARGSNWSPWFMGASRKEACGPEQKTPPALSVSGKPPNWPKNVWPPWTAGCKFCGTDYGRVSNKSFPRQN